MKSVYLSTARFAKPEEQEAYKKTLETTGENIRAGQEPAFDVDELARLRREQQALVESVKPGEPTGIGLRVVLPLILFGVLVYALLAILSVV